MMTLVWKFASGQDTWSRSSREQPGTPKAVSRTASDPQQPSSPPAANQSNPCRPNYARIDRPAPLWSGRLNATFAARVLPPAPGDRNNPRQHGVPGDLLYRNPAGQIVTRPLLTPEEAQAPKLTSIEWAVKNVLRRKYPQIHHEIVIAACEYSGAIAPGADPDFPDSVLATLPPEPGHTPPVPGDRHDDQLRRDPGP